MLLAHTTHANTILHKTQCPNGGPPCFQGTVLRIVGEAVLAFEIPFRSSAFEVICFLINGALAKAVPPFAMISGHLTRGTGRMWSPTASYRIGATHVDWTHGVAPPVAWRSIRCKGQQAASGGLDVESPVDAWPASRTALFQTPCLPCGMAVFQPPVSLVA